MKIILSTLNKGICLMRKKTPKDKRVTLNTDNIQLVFKNYGEQFLNDVTKLFKLKIIILSE